MSVDAQCSVALLLIYIYKLTKRKKSTVEPKHSRPWSYGVSFRHELSQVVKVLARIVDLYVERPRLVARGKVYKEEALRLREAPCRLEGPAEAVASGVVADEQLLESRLQTNGK